MIDGLIEENQKLQISTSKKMEHEQLGSRKAGYMS
jgi:hypothetical protein